MIENKTLSLFKHDQPIYQSDLINWLDKNTKITCKEIVIKGKASINQEAHPFFKEFLDLILDYRPDCKIILYTNALIFQPLIDIMNLKDKAELIIELPAYNKFLYKKLIGNNNFDKIVQNIKSLKAYSEHNQMKCFIKIISPFFGDIEQACFRKQMLDFVDEFDYF